ncbi:hypothetical protein [Pseudosporangium ferrugineum]|uniref:hypothetical protein n=1 Tax=Pseudosporangium ferrugineum TaxID=439699 RepID=UPI00147457ED|nr:hypothetical protein [Pseudosporangium ferrugineum]
MPGTRLGRRLGPGGGHLLGGRLPGSKLPAVGGKPPSVRDKLPAVGSEPPTAGG